MKKVIFTGLTIIGCFGFSAWAKMPNTHLNLMPYPQSVSLGKGALAVNGKFSLYIDGYRSPRIEKLAKRLISRIETQTGLPLLSPFASDVSKASLVIRVQKPAKKQIQDLNADESYQLQVNPKQAVLSSERPYGVIRGAETFLQLLTTTNQGYHVPCVSIRDYPRFPWRGASFDTARHFISIKTIKRQIDGFASAKMNVFHWHLWDDQAIRIQIDSYPKLWQKTADGHYYTKAQIKDVVEYARLRGIRVIPEISLPGHASAVAHAYPELMSGMGKQHYNKQYHWGVFEPLMDPTNPELYVFLDKVFSEVVALFPDEYVHIGGDEPNYKQWNNNPKIQSFITAHKLDGNRGLQSYLNTKVEKILEKKGKKIEGWDEIWHKDLPKSVVIQSWRGHDSIGRAAQQGYAGVLSTGFYLDQPQPSSYHYRNDPMPHSLMVDDQLHEGEQFATYTWKKPRGKGSPRKGNLTIITSKSGRSRAFVDYNGKSRAKVVIDSYQPDVYFRGHFDNFMSYVEFNLYIHNGRLTPDSYQLVGNVRWPTTGYVSASSEMNNVNIPKPSGGYPVTLTKSQKKLILGGEAAIWGENYNDLTVDGRIWPRTYVVAERLWSNRDLTDTASMYKRLQAMDRWATISVGLRHQTNRLKQLTRLANGRDVIPLMKFARYAEPAQYYARNWAKWNATDPKGKLYGRMERLNRFSDAVSVESFAVYHMDNLANKALTDPKARTELEQYYKEALDSARKSKDIFMQNIASIATAELAQKYINVAQAALGLIKKINQNNVNQADLAHVMQVIKNASAVYDEMVVAIIRPLEKLVNAQREFNQKKQMTTK